MKKTVKFILLVLIFLPMSMSAQDLKLGLPVSHVGTIYDLEFSPDASLMVSGGQDRMMHVFDIETGKRLMGFGPFDKPVEYVKFVSDHQIITLQDTKDFLLCDLETNSVKSVLTDPDPKVVEHVALMVIPEKDRMITGKTWDDFSTSQIQIINTSNWEAISQIDISLEAIMGCFPDVSYQKDRLVITDQNNRVSVYDIVSGERLHSIRFDGEKISGASVSPDSNWLALIEDRKRVILYDLRNEEKVHEFSNSGQSVFNMKWFYDSSQLAVHFSNSMLRTYDLPSGREVRAITYSGEPKFKPMSGLFSNNGLWFSVITKDESLCRIDLLTGDKKTIPSSGQMLWNSSGVVNDNGLLLVDYGKSGATLIGNPESSPDIRAEQQIGELKGRPLFSYRDSKIELSNGNLIAYVSPLDGSSDWHTKNTIQIWDLRKGKKHKDIFSRTRIPVVHSKDSGAYFYRGGYGKKIFKYDLSTGRLTDFFELPKPAQAVKIIDYSDEKRLLVVHGDFTENKIELSLFDTENRSYLKSFSSTGPSYLLKDIRYDFSTSIKKSGDYLAFKRSRDTVSLLDLKQAKLIDNIPFEDSFYMSDDGSFLYTIDSSKQFNIYNTKDGTLVSRYKNYSSNSEEYPFKVIYAAIQDRVYLDLVGHDPIVFDLETSAFSETDTFFRGEATFDGNYLISYSGNELRIFNRINGEFVESLKLDQEFIKSVQPMEIVFSYDFRYLAMSDEKSGGIFIFDLKTDSIIQTISGFSTLDFSFDFVQNNTALLTTSLDGSVAVYEIENGKKLIEQVLFENDSDKWVHLYPSGLFDASPEAMEMMYWTQGTEIIEFSQLKNRYWLPGLWEKVTSGDPLPDVDALRQINLQPEVKVGRIEDFMVPVHIKKRSGGYGPIALFLNGKEIDKDIRDGDFNPALDEQTLYISIKDHPYLLAGDNAVEVRASSADEVIQGRGSKGSLVVEKKDAVKPSFFAVIVGVGQYANDQINLRYTINDAEAISKSVAIGAGNLFGEDRTFVYTLTSGSSNEPNKANMQSVFKEISEKAKADDIIMVYLSGHGISTSGTDGDFYFLTSEAISADASAYSDPAIRSRNTVSTTEFVGWLKDIAALKQVMIIDACGSGKAVDNLLDARNVDPSQIKAIDRMKDRTGMFIISGCAADAVSFEASRFGQGLLTYSILQAFKGAALRQDRYVDVLNIMNYAREVVPELASGIGGIQTPQLLIPKGGSFDIGVLDDSDKAAIPLAEPKQIFVRSTFVEQNEFEDILDLSDRVDKRLDMLSARGDASDLIFFDTSKYPDACKLSGGYEKTVEGVKLNLRIRCGNEVRNIDLQAESVESLVDKIEKEIAN